MYDLLDEIDLRQEIWNDPENEDNYDECEHVESGLPSVKPDMIKMLEEMIRMSDKDLVRRALDKLVEKL